jgi:peptide/nickel transport system ATP-binding protein
MGPHPPLLQLRDVARTFDVSPPWLDRVLERKPRALLKAVDGVSLTIASGETLGLVGESGCGKSTVARLIVGLYSPTRGAIEFDGAIVAGDGAIDGTAQRAARRGMQMIFQDPYASLNPRWRVRDIVAEPMRILQTKKDVAELLRQVGLSPEDADRYPHEFSGGQRQRISIARALAGEPELLICDEPTSALDVSVQAQILNLMADLQERLGLTYLFISHNLAVVSLVADRVGVMYLGKIVELAPVAQLFAAPRELEKSPTATARRILVADDFPESASALAKLLRSDGNDVQVAHDGLEALDTIARFHPHVVVLDIAMPKLNGYDAARIIREQPWGKNIKLIAMTGWGHQQDLRRTKEAGFDHHLTKPVAPDTIEELIRRS